MSDQGWANDPEQMRRFAKRAKDGGMSRRVFLKILAAAGAGSAILSACDLLPPAIPATVIPTVNLPAPAVTLVKSTEPVPQIQASQVVPDAEQVFRDVISAEPASMDYNGDLYCGGPTEIWAGLMRFNNEYKPVPYGARSVAVQDNVWTFTLDPNWLWTNGDRVTAHDFEWSWHRMLHPGVAAPYAPLLFDVQGAEAYNNRTDLKSSNDELTPAVSGVGIRALDVSTLQVTLNGPRGYFGAIVAYVAALPNHRQTVEANGETFKTDAVKSSEPGIIVTNGPFKLTKWDHQKSCELQRSEVWALQPRPTLRKVTYAIIAETAQLASYEKNEIDRAAVQSGDINRLKNDPKLRQELVIFSATGAFYLVPNPNMQPFDVRGVRRALEHAIDREAIVNNVLQGVGKPAYTFDPPDLPQYIDPAKFPEIVPLTKFDPQMAMDELRGTPYEGGRNWPPIKLSYRTNEESIGSSQAVQAIQAMLRENLNMRVDLDPLEPQVFRQSMVSHRQQFTWVRWYSDYPDSNNNLYQVWYSGPGASGHRHDFVNAEFNDLVTAAKNPTDNDERVRLYAQAEVVGLRDGYATYVYYLYAARVYKPWVGNLPKNNRGELVQDVNIFAGMPEAIQIVEAEGRPHLS